MKKFKRADENATAVIVDGKLWNRLVTEVERLGNLAVSAPLKVTDGPAGKTISIAPGASESITVRLTDFTDPTYDWVEVDPAADGTYSERTGGRTSDDYGAAIDPTGGNAFNADATDGDVVVIKRGNDPDDGTILWTIAGTPGGGSIDIYNDGTLVQAVAASLNLDHTLTDVLAIAAWTDPDSGDGAKLAAVGGTPYEVVQWDTGGTRLVTLPVRAT